MTVTSVPMIRCNPATGCVNTNNTAPCDDGDACTSRFDTCKLSVPVWVDLLPTDDDSDVCTDDSCNPADRLCHIPTTPLPAMMGSSVRRLTSVREASA